MICTFCNKSIGGGGILRLKQHLAGIRGQVKPCDAPKEVIGPARVEYFAKFEKFEENKAREKAIQEEIARKKEILQAMKESGDNDFEMKDSFSIPSTNDPFHCVPPALGSYHQGQQSKGTKRMNISFLLHFSPLWKNSNFFCCLHFCFPSLHLCVLISLPLEFSFSICHTLPWRPFSQLLQLAKDSLLQSLSPPPSPVGFLPPLPSSIPFALPFLWLSLRGHR